MTENVLELLRDFRREVAPPDERAMQRIYPLATAPDPCGWRALLQRLARPRLVLAALAATLAAAGGASALAIHYLGPSPGFTAGFSAFDRLPPTAWPSSMPRIALDRSAAYMGVSPVQFEQGLRRLRTGLTLGPGRSRGHGELYAYVGGDRTTACMFLTGQGGGCVNATNVSHVQGVLTQLFPGYPGQTPAVVAIVADNVESVDLVYGGRHVDVPIVNNSVYADLEGLEAGESIELHATYNDGSSWVYPLLNPSGETRERRLLTPHRR